MTRHLADSDDLAEWAELAEAVLADPVYRDRLEWFEYERRLHRDGAAAAVQYARDAGWVDMTDTFAWSGVDMEMLGTSFTKPIPRTHTSGTAAPAAPAVFPYSSGPAVSGVPSVRKRTARARQGRAGLGWPSGVNLAAVRAQQEQLARRQERRKRQSERRQQQTEGGNAGDSEEGGIEEVDEGYMNLEKVSSDWLLDMVQKQQASIEEKRTKAGRQDEMGSEGSQAGKEPSALAVCSVSSHRISAVLHAPSPTCATLSCQAASVPAAVGAADTGGALCMAVLSSDGTHRRLLLPRRTSSAVPPPLATSSLLQAGVGSPGAQAPVQGEGEGGVAEGSESHTHGREAASLWPEPAPQGWVAHAGVRDTAVWPAPAEESNGFVVVRCNGGLNQQRSAVRDGTAEGQRREAIAGCIGSLPSIPVPLCHSPTPIQSVRLLVLPILPWCLCLFHFPSHGSHGPPPCSICNAVVVARIMNATLVLPRLDTNEFWNDTSGFATVYDVDHFIATLAADVRIVKDLPPHITADKRAKLVRLRPPREAPVQWYESDALRVLRRRGGVYLTPFAHRLAEELGTGSVALELQRLRCRANFHALRFHPAVHALADSVMARMRARSAALGMQGRFIAVHLRFEKDMLAFAGCFNIFSEEQQVELKAYREANFAEKELEQSRRRRIGKCPLTPHEVGLTLRAMGFPNSTLLYLAGGAVYGGEAFMRPLQALFPNIVRRADVATAEEMEAVEGHGRALLGQAVDYIVCTKVGHAPRFLRSHCVPSYDGPSNFANNVLGHRLYLGFLPSLRPDRRSLSRVLDEREAGGITEDVFGPAVKNVLRKIPSASPFPRRHGHMAFFADPWPECFCQNPSTNSNVEGGKIRAKDTCPRHVAEEIAHI
ncbi:unnamed protein product [Closterium sp. Naga37s-1]|nr:unnamed protein product [Closterium sp. Naga37s-1]